MNFTEIKLLVATKREEIIQNMLSMSAIPSVNPKCGGNGEYQRTKWITNLLEDKGIPYQVFSYPDPEVPEGVRLNVVVRIPGKTDPKKTLWFISHTDTVGEGDRSSWNTDPFTPQVIGDQIFGLGVEDNSQAVICTLAALFLLVEQNIQPACSVGFIYSADEETGSDFGLNLLVKEDIFGPRDEAVVPDYGCADGSFIEIAEKSAGNIKFTITGRQGHASMPHLCANAFSIGCRFTASLEDDLKNAFKDQDALYDPPYSTFEPTQTFSNVGSPNVIPGTHTFYMDLRVLPHIPLQDIFSRIENLIADFEQRYPVKIAYAPRISPAPPITPADAPIVQNLLASVRENGVSAKLGGIGGGTCAAILREKNLPAVVWSTLIELAHQPNEHVLINNLLTDTSVFLATILKY